MKRTVLMIAAAAAIGVASCSTGDAQTDHEMACGAGMLTGAVIGGLVGNQFGKGGGRSAMTALGAGAGTYAGNRLAC